MGHDYDDYDDDGDNMKFVSMGFNQYRVTLSMCYEEYSQSLYNGT